MSQTLYDVKIGDGMHIAGLEGEHKIIGVGCDADGVVLFVNRQPGDENTPTARLGRILAAMQTPDPGPRTWAVPDEPGPDVTALRDSAGDVWHRDGDFWRFGMGTALEWGELLAAWGPLTEVVDTGR